MWTNYSFPHWIVFTAHRDFRRACFVNIFFEALRPHPVPACMIFATPSKTMFKIKVEALSIRKQFGFERGTDTTVLSNDLDFSHNLRCEPIRVDHLNSLRNALASLPENQIYRACIHICRESDLALDMGNRQRRITRKTQGLRLRGFFR